MKRKYRVWCPDDGEEDSSRAVVAHNPDQAAEEFVRRLWGAMDQPKDVYVNVRAPRGDLTGWRVHAEQEVTFRAARGDLPT